MAKLLERLLGRLPIGWLQLSHHRGRLLVALGGVAFANILVFMQLGFLGALTDSIGLPYQAMNADILVSASDMNTLADGSPLPRFRQWEVSVVDGVESVVPMYYGKLDWKQADGTIRTLDVLGVAPDAAAFAHPEMARLQASLALDQSALLDRRTRNVDPAIFSKVASGQHHVFEIKGRALTVTHTFDLGGGFSADGYLIVSDQTFLKFFPSRSSAAPNLLLVKVRLDTPRASVLARIQSSMAGDDSRAQFKEDSIRRDQAFQTTQRPVGLVFGFGLGIGIIVGMIIVYQILSADVADHIREYATIKAIGYRQQFFLGIIVEEAIILAVLGFIPGFLISSGLYLLVAHKTGLPLHMDVVRPVMVLLGTTLACMASGALATKKLGKANPADLF